MTAGDLAACSLGRFVPDNAAEYCCERACYDDPACAEDSAFLLDGVWVAEVSGRYALTLETRRR